MNLLQISALVFALVGVALFIKQKSSKQVPWPAVLPPVALLSAFLLSVIGSFIGNDEGIDKATVRLQLAVARTEYLYPAEKLKQKINSGTVIYLTRSEATGPSAQPQANPPEEILKEGLGNCTLKIVRLSCMTLEAKDLEAALASHPQGLITDIGLNTNEEVEAVLEKSKVSLLLIGESNPGSVLHYLQSGYVFAISSKKNSSWNTLISQANGVTAQSSSEELFNLGYEFYDKNHLPGAVAASVPPPKKLHHEKAATGSAPIEQPDEE